MFQIREKTHWPWVNRRSFNSALGILSNVDDIYDLGYNLSDMILEGNEIAEFVTMYEDRAKRAYFKGKVDILEYILSNINQLDVIELRRTLDEAVKFLSR